MSKRNKIRVLSIDGGGIRGIIPAKVLVHIEKLIHEKKGPDRSISDYFDMIVGTSTGAILGAMLLVPDASGKPKFNAKDALEFYTTYGELIFNQSIKRKSLVSRIFKASKYSENNLELLFEQKLGNTKLSDLLKPCIITTYNMKGRNAVFFNSREQDANKPDHLLRDVLRSTSAAPTYFDPAFIGNPGAQMINIDGGVFANNPAMCAYAECRSTRFENWQDKDNPQKEFPTAKNIQMLSLGTGGGYIDLGETQESKGWGMLTWAKKTPDIMMDGGLDTVNYQVQKLFQSLDSEADRKNFKRVDFPKNPNDDKPPYDTDMANADQNNVAVLKKAGEHTIIHANANRPDEHTLDEFIGLLINEEA